MWMTVKLFFLLNSTFSFTKASSMPFQHLCSNKHKHKDLPGVESCEETTN